MRSVSSKLLLMGSSLLPRQLMELVVTLAYMEYLEKDQTHKNALLESFLFYTAVAYDIIVNI